MVLFPTMRIPLSALFLFLGVIALPAGDYQVKAVKVLPVDSYPARTELGEITIAADPYDYDERSYTAFDIKNLNSRGYNPLHVIVRNNSRNYMNLRTRNIVLITPEGQQLYSTPATVLVEDVSNSKSTKLGSPLSDFTSKELTNRLLDPGTVTDGFLFFFTPNPKKSGFFAGCTLYIPKLEEEGTRKGLGPFAIPLDPALKK